MCPHRGGDRSSGSGGAATALQTASSQSASQFLLPFPPAQFTPPFHGRATSGIVVGPRQDAIGSDIDSSGGRMYGCANISGPAAIMTSRNGDVIDRSAAARCPETISGDDVTSADVSDVADDLPFISMSADFPSNVATTARLSHW